MNTSDLYFAKNQLTFEVKLLVSLRLTQRKFFKRQNWEVMLTTLMCGANDNATATINFAIGNIKLNTTTVAEAQKYFVSLFHDEDFIIDYINKKVTHRTFVPKDNLEPDIVKDTLNAIFNKTFSKMGLNGV